MVDFATIRPAENAETPATLYLDYEGEPVYMNGDVNLQLEIDLYGLDGETGRRAAARAAKARARITRGRRQQPLERQTEDQILRNAEDVRQIDARFYAQLTAGWRNVPDLGATPDKDGNLPLLEFTTENAAALYAEHRWLAGELDDFLANRGNFEQSQDAA